MPASSERFDREIFVQLNAIHYRTTVMLEILCWTSLFLLLYAYFGYPAVLLFVSKIKETSEDREVSDNLELKDCCPSVSIVIAAHNEESIIEKRIKNLLAVDYPREKLEILIVSDASTDRTNRIVSQYTDRGIRFIARDKREGKTAALNFACPLAKGDILVFTDANGNFEPDSVKILVRHFADPNIGCVSGRVRYYNPRQTAAHQGESLYMRYDTWVKRLESKLGSVMGAFGGIFAFRREFFQPMDAMVPVDLEIPLQILRRRRKVLFESSAVCTEPASGRLDVEFARHARINARLFYGMSRWVRELLSPLRPLVLFQFMSKKVLRWFSPFVFFALIVIPFLLAGPLYTALSVANTMFLVACGIGALLSWRGRSMSMFSFALHFLIGNLAVVWGFGSFLAGRQGPTWSVARPHI